MAVDLLSCIRRRDARRSKRPKTPKAPSLRTAICDSVKCRILGRRLNDVDGQRHGDYYLTGIYRTRMDMVPMEALMKLRMKKIPKLSPSASPRSRRGSEAL